MAEVVEEQLLVEVPLVVITLIKLTDILSQINEEPQSEFNRVKYYEKYYKNLSPTDFKVQSKDNNIIINLPN